jgi:hypothetical protein
MEKKEIIALLEKFEKGLLLQLEVVESLIDRVELDESDE